MRKENYDYWNNRADGYSEVNIEELEGVQRENWTNLLVEAIEARYPNCDRGHIKILDIGAGPGFLSIILSEQGFCVTAADYSEEMIRNARKNARNHGVEFSIYQENAECLSFDDGVYDVIVSRNLTWNLPNPETAYSEWLRVLKPDGLMMIFDANWYSYLCDEDSKAAYERDRANVESSGFDDYNIGENFDKMEKIAAGLPLTGVKRPDWDKLVLSQLGVSNIEIVENIGKRVYSQKEKINYESTPLFMIKVIKE